jgi:hypothetical protein
MGPDKKPIQLRHRSSEIEAICVIFAQLTTEEFVPRALIELAVIDHPKTYKSGQLPV